MPIAVVSTIKMDREKALQLATKAAPLAKRHGATGVRCGYCHSGSHTGAVTVVMLYPDWQTYGKAAQAMYEDKAYQAMLAEVTKAGEFLDRSIMVLEDL